MTLIFVILIGGAVGVLVFLPGEKSGVSTSPPGGEVQLSPPSKPAAGLPESRQTEAQQKASIDVQTIVAERQDAAQQAREQVWALRIEAEAQNISGWAGEEYEQIVDRLEEADTLLREKVWSEAEEKYLSVLTDLQALLETREQRYAQALEEGQRSLVSERPDLASEFFRRALLIKPSSAEAKNGLAQAEQLAALLLTYQQALLLEEQGELAEAVARLEEIIGAGSSFEPALEARQRIQAELDEELFQQEMNLLFAALRSEDFSAARRSLETLKNLGLRRQEVEQAAALLAEYQTRAEIGRLKSEAEKFSHEEEWQQAVEAYGAILHLDPDLLFASAGQDEAAKRAELDRSMSDAVARSQRLQDAGQRSAAANLLDYARRIEPQGPRLQGQIEALDMLLEKFRTPVSITLESNNQTLVTIYHVGRIAPFVTTKINLKPGTYTLVGSRAGYRDVRLQITVGPDTGENRYDISCEEAI